MHSLRNKTQIVMDPYSFEDAFVTHRFMQIYEKKKRLDRHDRFFAGYLDTIGLHLTTE